MHFVSLKKVITLVVLGTFIISLTGCGFSEDIKSKSNKAKTDNKIRLGFSLATLQEERWQRDRDIFVAKAKELGADVIVQNANNNSDDQISQVKYLLEQNIDVLLIVPQDAEKEGAAVQLAKKAGVQVISYDRLIQNADVDMYISFDNVKVGEIMAEQLVEKVPAGNYVIINGAKTDNNCIMFNEGYKKVLKPYIARGDINLISETSAVDWRPEDSFNAVENLLKNGNKIDAIIAANDSLAGAAIEALAEQRLAGTVEVAGHDADLSGCQRVAEGTQLVTVYKPIDKIAQKAAEIAIKMAKGEQVTANSMINDGKYIVPYYMIPPIQVTKSNLKETVIQDGFHRLEDVYLNVPKAQWPTN